MGSRNDSTVTADGTRARRCKRSRPVEVIKVRMVPLGTPEATAAAIGLLIEEWAALTYSCLVEAAMASQAANDPMQPRDAAVAPSDVRGK